MDLGTARLGLARFHAALGRHDEAIALFDAGARAMTTALPDDRRLAVTLALERARLLDLAGSSAAQLQWQSAMDVAERTLAEGDAVRVAVAARRARADGRARRPTLARVRSPR